MKSPGAEPSPSEQVLRSEPGPNLLHGPEWLKSLGKSARRPTMEKSFSIQSNHRRFSWLLVNKNQLMIFILNQVFR